LGRRGYIALKGLRFTSPWAPLLGISAKILYKKALSGITDIHDTSIYTHGYGCFLMGILIDLTL
jgi:hypothetical protein